MKKNIFAGIMAIVLLIPCAGKTAEPEVEFKFTDKDAVVLVSSMIINGLIGGIGAHLNNSPHANIWHDQNFWQGFSQGAIGGTFNYAGMKVMTLQNEWEYSILTGKQVSDFGTSLTYSAALGENWLDNPRYITDFGPLVFNWSKDQGLRPDITVMPGSAISTVYAFTEGNLNLETTFKTGSLTFDGQAESAGNYKEDHRDGVHICNLSIIPTEENPLDNTPAWNYNITLAHEAIHGRQYFMWTALDPTIDYYLKVGPARMNELSYDNHPIRIGADLGASMWTFAGGLSRELGTPFNYSINEYANFNLFNYTEF